MAWNDRLREAAYTSPGGTRIAFDYETVSRSVEKTGSAFSFPGVDGNYIQVLGRSGRRYPLRVIFWGDDHDLQSDAFEALLLESGAGSLEHPVYGQLDVVPFGEISRRDDLKTAANQSVIDVTFWETLPLLYPTSQASPASVVIGAVDEFNASIAAEYADAVGDLSVSETAVLKGDYQRLLDGLASSVSDLLVPAGGAVATQFNAVFDSINSTIDTAIKEPLALAFQTGILIQSPARGLSAIQDRLDAYGNLARSIVGGDSQSRDSSQLRVLDLYASTYVTGQILSVVNTTFETKPQALAAAEAIFSVFEDVQDWRDSEFDRLGQIDTGASFQQLQEAVAVAVGFLVEISFTLKQERSITLTRARTIVDLCYELYGSVDDQLDFLINTNAMTGDEIIEIPAGRTVVYYV